MSLLKNGLNQEFYKWIDDVRRAFRKKDELERELKELERRLVGYNAVSYDLIGDKGLGVDEETKILNILSKLAIIKISSKKIECILKNYTVFLKSINEQEKDILKIIISYKKVLFVEDDKQLLISRNKYYTIRKAMIRKWYRESKD